MSKLKNAMERTAECFEEHPFGMTVAVFASCLAVVILGKNVHRFMMDLGTVRAAKNVRIAIVDADKDFVKGIVREVVNEVTKNNG